MGYGEMCVCVWSVCGCVGVYVCGCVRVCGCVTVWMCCVLVHY